MSTSVDPALEQTRKDFQDTLNRHGYGFQYSLLAHMDTLKQAGKSRWNFEAAEFPVEVQGKGTRIDFLLSRPPAFGAHELIYMVAECKRANPAMSNWCFITAPYVDRKGNFKSSAIERVQNNNGLNLTTSTVRHFTGRQAQPYHVAIEVKTKNLGDATGARAEAIEEAATQVCRGLNGLVESLGQNLHLLGHGQQTHLLPVIFTTAQLWTSDADLGAADLLNGKIDLSTTEFSQQAWVLYEYHMSPGLKHGAQNTGDMSTFGDLMETEYVRTVPVVSAAGVADFLEWAGALDLSR